MRVGQGESAAAEVSQGVTQVRQVGLEMKELRAVTRIDSLPSSPKRYGAAGEEGED